MNHLIVYSRKLNNDDEIPLLSMFLRKEGGAYHLSDIYSYCIIDEEMALSLFTREGRPILRSDLEKLVEF